MKLLSLLENTTVRPDVLCAHGLSLYLETDNHTILFDFGPDDRLLQNARTLGIDLSRVDLAVLSHGHNDHGGGLRAFLECNHTAPVYIRNNAFTPHRSARGANGLDPALASHSQIVYTGESHRIDSHLQLLSGITGRKFFASSNASLFQVAPDGTVFADDFSHEQSLLVQEGGICLLLAGCAHCGIVNILEAAEHIAGRPMTHVVSGFHLCQPSLGIDEPPATVCAISAELSARPTQFYTCHCTGHSSYEILRRETNSQVHYLSGGEQIIL